MNIEKTVMLGISEAPKFMRVATKLVMSTDITQYEKEVPIVVGHVAALMAIGSNKTRTEYLVKGFIAGACTVYVINKFKTPKKEAK